MTWVKGQSGNPNGRPRQSAVEELRKALKEVETEKGKSFVKHFVEKSYGNPMMSVALMRKLYPDQVQIEGAGESPVERVNEFIESVDAKDQGDAAGTAGTGIDSGVQG